VAAFAMVNEILHIDRLMAGMSEQTLTLIDINGKWNLHGKRQ
jgi:hypothetical protein